MIHDFDGDGRKDLLALDADGMLTLYRRTSPLEFASGQHIPDERGAPIKLDGKGRETGRAMLTLMDWNGDGKLDLIAGSEGGWVYYYRHK